MKKIGFIDYYISEWHANNYPVWIKEVCDKYGYDFEVSYAWAELETSLVDGKTTDQWCESFNVQKCDTIKELCEKSDFIVILAPSDPDKHLGYALEAFKYAKGKKMYIDKTFAPDYDTAKAIFDGAKQNDVQFFSTSALRYADELNSLNNVKQLNVYGGGSNFPEYSIHQVEMLVKVMGLGANAVKASQNQDEILTIDVAYPDGKKATLNYNKSFGFKLEVVEDNNVNEIKIQSDFFRNLLKDIIEFFQGKPVPFDTNQTLEVMKVREYALKAMSNQNVWIKF